MKVNLKQIYEGRNLLDLSNMRYLPRWIVLGIDVFILSISLFLSLAFLEMLGIEFWEGKNSLWSFVIILINIGFMLLFRTYAGIIRHSTLIDLFKIFLSSLFTVLFFLAISFFAFKEVSFTLFAVFYLGVSFIFLFSFRLFVKEFFYVMRESNRNILKKRILVLGINDESVAIASAIIGNPALPYEVVGFLEEKKYIKKASILGKKIYRRRNIEKNTKEKLNIEGVLINEKNIDKEELDLWVNLFLEKGLLVLKTPAMQKLRPEKNISIHKLQIEDLLSRKPIVIEDEAVNQRHNKKNILVTGGAGSIGSELVRQVATFNPNLIVVLDQAETPLYDVELEMKEKFPKIQFKFILEDISNYGRMESVFQEYQFSMVYHAAAYKHVPLIEENPHSAVFSNIQGSKNVALLASKYKVNRFVMISTDKAVNPTNVMGASKRVAELFVQSLQHTENNITKFITTRFGNVLGSNGSVIPHFKKQIEKGGPVTITHPDIVRYFMTIPEACTLVLQAGTMGKGGEIFVFDMGKPVKILNLATRMIKLSGFEPNVDIEIIYTGLRPGEKLYEELLSDNTKTLPTHHEKIMISKDLTMDFEQINLFTEKIIDVAKIGDKVRIVSILKDIVKEFKSNNSIYEKLDQKDNIEGDI